jgi:hypothetical protein
MKVKRAVVTLKLEFDYTESAIELADDEIVHSPYGLKSYLFDFVMEDIQTKEINFEDLQFDIETE